MTKLPVVFREMKVRCCSTTCPLYFVLEPPLSLQALLLSHPHPVQARFRPRSQILDGSPVNVWQVMEFEPDVLCLQEVDEGLYRNFFLKHLVSCHVNQSTVSYIQREGKLPTIRRNGFLAVVADARFSLAEPWFWSAWDEGA